MCGHICGPYCISIDSVAIYHFSFTLKAGPIRLFSRCFFYQFLRSEKLIQKTKSGLNILAYSTESLQVVKVAIYSSMAMSFLAAFLEVKKK